MDTNPYQSPHAVPEQGSPPARPLWPNVGGFERVALFGLGLVFFAAAVHRCQFYFDADSYDWTPLILLDLYGFLGSLLMIPVFFIRAVYLTFRQQDLAAAVALFVSFVAFAVAAFVVMTNGSMWVV